MRFEDDVRRLVMDFAVQLSLTFWAAAFAGFAFGISCANHRLWQLLVSGAALAWLGFVALRRSFQLLRAARLLSHLRGGSR